MKATLSRLWDAALRSRLFGSRKLAELEQQNETQQSAIAALEQQNQTQRSAITALEEQNETQRSVITALEPRLALLEAQNAALTESAMARERQLQAKAELDYQILMIHQHLLAEFKDTEPEFLALYELYKPFTMTSIERLYSLFKSVEYVAEAGVPGDLAECGVWRGGSCMMIAATLIARGRSDRRILLFDTFEGHPMPDPDRDVDLWGNRAYPEWQGQTSNGTVKRWGLATLDEVRRNLELTGYPDEKLIYIKGMVEETAPTNIPDRLSLLRLDTDWYNSTRSALLYLYPRLAPGGVLILDDYGHYKGQREAVDEYLRETGERLLFHRIDYSCRIAVKPGPN